MLEVNTGLGPSWSSPICVFLGDHTEWFQPGQCDEPSHLPASLGREQIQILTHPEH